MQAHWKLRETLAEAGITVYALADCMGGSTRRPALYAITSVDLDKRPRRVSFDLLEDIVEALLSLTGKLYSACDLIELIEDASSLESRNM